jgi:PAB1-binding protein PBP1
MNKDAKGNIHLAEERGQVYLRDNENEEIMYSGVVRNKSKQSTSKLTNPKKFKCIRKNLVAFPSTQNQMSSSFVGGLLNPGQWVSFELNEDSKPVSGPK